jgi:hypothetical protein
MDATPFAGTVIPLIKSGGPADVTGAACALLRQAGYEF